MFYCVPLNFLNFALAEAWLMGRNCEIQGDHCDWQHCTDQCGLLAGGDPNLGDQFHAQKGQKFLEIMLGQTTPGQFNIFLIPCVIVTFIKPVFPTNT